jgi:hypothetical protein
MQAIIIQGDSRENVNILGIDSICHYGGEIVHVENVSNCELLER